MDCFLSFSASLFLCWSAVASAHPLKMVDMLTLFCNPFQMPDICDACALCFNMYIFVSACFVHFGRLFGSSQLCFAIFVMSKSFLSLVLSSILFFTLCTSTLFSNSVLGHSLFHISSWLWLILLLFQPTFHHHWFCSWIALWASWLSLNIHIHSP